MLRGHIRKSQDVRKPLSLEKKRTPINCELGYCALNTPKHRSAPPSILEWLFSQGHFFLKFQSRNHLSKSCPNDLKIFSWLFGALRSVQSEFGAVPSVNICLIHDFIIFLLWEILLKKIFFFASYGLKAFPH